MTLTQTALEMGPPIGTIGSLAHRTDLTLVLEAEEVEDLKWCLGEKADPYRGFYLKRGEYGSIIELYGFHEHKTTSSIFVVEPEGRRNRYEQ